MTASSVPVSELNRLILRNKVVFLGAAASGKTSLIQSFHGDTKKEFSTTYSMTVHSETSVKIVNIPDSNVTVELCVADVAGNEIFSEYIPKYCKGATSYVLVFDTTQPESFSLLSKWLNYLKQIKTLKNSRGILVATKLDQTHRRAVGQEEAERFAKQNSMAYFETSALDPNSADAPFYYIAHNFHERFEAHVENTSKASIDD